MQGNIIYIVIYLCRVVYVSTTDINKLQHHVHTGACVVTSYYLVSKIIVDTRTAVVQIRWAVCGTAVPCSTHALLHGTAIVQFLH